MVDNHVIWGVDCWFSPALKPVLFVSSEVKFSPSVLISNRLLPRWLLPEIFLPPREFPIAWLKEPVNDGSLCLWPALVPPTNPRLDGPAEPTNGLPSTSEILPVACMVYRTLSRISPYDCPEPMKDWQFVELKLGERFGWNTLVSDLTPPIFGPSEKSLAPLISDSP